MTADSGSGRLGFKLQFESLEGSKLGLLHNISVSDLGRMLRFGRLEGYYVGFRIFGLVYGVSKRASGLWLSAGQTLLREACGSGGRRGSASEGFWEFFCW